MPELVSELPEELRAVSTEELEKIDGGATAVEFGLLAALSSIAAMPALLELSMPLNDIFSQFEA